jgi:enamine deaminase RidA (YjgF/YER057c/UK114 family)
MVDLLLPEECDDLSPLESTNSMHADYDSKLESLGYLLAKTTPEGKLVDALSIDGVTIYASGQVPFDGDTLTSRGKVPSEISVEVATQAAALCAANVLRAVRKQIGSLDKIERVLRVTGYVNADPDFTDEHLVINGASELLLHVFGQQGRHARTAIGVAQLPLGASTEIEMILKLKSDTYAR